jgi:molybdenum cofactor synthesis domain-containing protein
MAILKKKNKKKPRWDADAMTKTSYTAAIIVIGNEILSGRTKDLNLGWLGEQLNLRGIRVKEARFIADDEAAIIDTVNDLRTKHSYVFTTGGIGPTHDDITASCIAKAFERPFEENPEARALLQEYYGDRLNEARLRMAKLPKGAELISNPVSAAPGIKIDNVYVMAGIPKIMQAMFHSVADTLIGGQVVQSIAIDCHFGEGDIAPGLTKIQSRHPDVEIGSYPACKPGDIAVSIILRHSDAPLLKAVAGEVQNMLDDLENKKTVTSGC